MLAARPAPVGGTSSGSGSPLQRLDVRAADHRRQEVQSALAPRNSATADTIKATRARGHEPVPAGTGHQPTDPTNGAATTTDIAALNTMRSTAQGHTTATARTPVPQADTGSPAA
ncbi:hypothetical protein ACIQNU_39725 [Streptomyces sp. NPDC091292]|uniref:hypothetical protein n=1 Tax=Streptomyces sp. NPDC091292 TaxID=3365991 RepID=UPI00382F583E